MSRVTVLCCAAWYPGAFSHSWKRCAVMRSSASPRRRSPTSPRGPQMAPPMRLDDWEIRVHGFFVATGRFAVRFRWAVVLAWLVMAVLAHLFLPSLASVGQDHTVSALPASSPSVQAARLATPFQ